MSPPASLSTTICSSAVALVTLLVWPAAAGGEAVVHSEVDLVRAYVSKAPARTRQKARQGRQRAAALVPPYLRHPELSVRREETFGGVEFSTTVLGLSLNLEVGGRHGLRQQAARLDARALGHQHAASRREAICGLRRLAHQAHAEQDAVGILAGAHKLLLGVIVKVLRLVKAGERAPFEAERLRLQLEEHGRRLAVRRARLAGLLAQLSVTTGLDVRAVGLTPTAPARPAATTPAARALEVGAEAAGLRLRAATRRWIPDLGLYAAYRLELAPGVDAGHGYEAGLTLSLPLTDAGRVGAGRARARRLALRSRLVDLQARRRARLAALAARVDALRANPRRGPDLAALSKAATRRYLAGVSPLSALLSARGAMERVYLQRAGQRAALSRMALEAACTRGKFDEAVMEKLAEVKP